MVYLRLILLFIFLLSCSSSELSIQETSFSENSIQLQLTSSIFLNSIELYSDDNRELSINPNLKNDIILIAYNWLPEKKYRVVINAEFVVDLYTPAKVETKGLELQIPIAQQKINLYSEEFNRFSFPFSKKVDAALFYNLDEKSTHELEIHLVSDKAIFSDSNKFSATISSSVYDLKNHFNFELNLGDLDSFKLSVKVKIDEEAEILRSYFFKNLSIEKLKESIQIEKSYTPSLADGTFSPFDEESVLQISDSFIDKVRRYFSTNQFYRNISQAFTHLAIKLENKSAEDRFLLAEIKILDALKKEAHPAFYPSDWKRSGFTRVSKSTQLIKGNSSGLITLPIYVDQDKINEGKYIARISVKLFASSEEIYREDKLIYVKKFHHFRLVLFLSMSALGLLGLLYFALKSRKIVADLHLEAVIAISIFASIHFAFNYIFTILDSSLLSLLGPFKVFLSGFFSETLSYAILVSLYIAYPKKGVIALKLLVSFFLSLVLSGGFYITALSNLGMNIIAYSVIFSLYKADRKSSFIFLFFSLAIYDAFRSYLSLLEMQVLYDFYYATWYIILYVSVIGFFYTILGVFLGKYLGRRFREVISS